jgi:hypothetical protein
MNFYTSTANLGTGETAIYSGSTGTGVAVSGGILIGLFAVHVDAATTDRTCSIYIRNTAAGSVDRYIVKDVSIFDNATLDALPGKVVLQGGDKIYGIASYAGPSVQVTASVVEL